MAGTYNSEEVERDATITRLRLSLLRAKLQKTQDEIDWEIQSFSLRNPDSVIE
jgi:hypothetical protein